MNKSSAAHTETRPAIMKGVNAAVLTPLNKDLSADLGRLYEHCLWLLENGCDGLGILGTTGEATSFSARERMDILQGLAKAGLPMDKTMPGTGAAAFTDTVDITRCAMEVGAGGVLMLPPFYYKDVSDDGIYNAYAEIIDRVSSPRLRVYLYHFPQMSGTPISHALISRLIADFPDTVVGVKDSSGVKQNMLEMIAKFPGFAVFPGSEAVFLEVLQAGGAGCITAISNISSAVAQNIYTTWVTEQKADQVANEMLQALREIISTYPLFGALKALMADHSEDDAWLRMRPPLTPLSPEDGVRLIAEIKALGYKIPCLG